MVLAALIHSIELAPPISATQMIPGKLLSNELRPLELHGATESQSLLVSIGVDVSRGD